MVVFPLRMTLAVAIVLSPTMTAPRAGAETRPPCVPARGVELLAASQTTAVFRRGERVIACGPGTPSRTLLTLTHGRNVDVVAVRGNRVAVAGHLSAGDAFGGKTVFNITRVLTLPTGISFEQQNFGPVRSVRLTPRGTAVGLERSAGQVALFAALPGGRLLLDRRPAIRHLRVRSERVAWTVPGRRRGYNTAVGPAAITLQGPIPSGYAPLSGAFVAPIAGRYSIVAEPVPNAGRSESCPFATTTVRANASSQRVLFELKPAYERWCQTKALDATLTLEFGRDAGPEDPPRCVGRPTPCGGSVRVGQVLLPSTPA